jgi:hypothetical protein
MPLTGLEPITVGLQNHCSTNWAKGADKQFQRAGLEPTNADVKDQCLTILATSKKNAVERTRTSNWKTK